MKNNSLAKVVSIVGARPRFRRSILNADKILSAYSK
jgi:hypothetical protein